MAWVEEDQHVQIWDTGHTSSQPWWPGSTQQSLFLVRSLLDSSWRNYLWLNSKFYQICCNLVKCGFLQLGYSLSWSLTSELCIWLFFKLVCIRIVYKLWEVQSFWHLLALSTPTQKEWVTIFKFSTCSLSFTLESLFKILFCNWSYSSMLALKQVVTFHTYDNVCKIKII